MSDFNTRSQMTPRQRVALEYLAQEVCVNVHKMGRVVFDKVPGRNSNLQGIGSAILMHLRRKGYAICSGSGQWQITSAGFHAISESEGYQSDNGGQSGK